MTSHFAIMQGKHPNGTPMQQPRVLILHLIFYKPSIRLEVVFGKGKEK